MTDTPSEQRESPWIGPRPYRSDMKLFLWGRKPEKERFLALVRSKQVVELTGDSGVGKTSLLECGLRPQLERVGYVIPPTRSWSELQGLTGAEIYCQALRRPFDAERAGTSVLEAARSFGDQAVLIFDQFEELIRYRPTAAEEFLDEVAIVANRTNVRQVISLRSEYKTSLANLEEQVGGKDLDWMPIKPVSRKALREIIEKPAEQVGLVLGDGVVDRIFAWWDGASSEGQKASQAQGSALARQLGGSPVGLLHLQALLWSLYEWWIAAYPDESVRTIDVEQLQQFANDKRSTDLRVDADHLSEGAELITRALLDYVEAHVGPEHFSPSAAKWPVGAEVMTARAAPQLSAAGYKLPREFGSLVWLSLDTMLRRYGGVQRKTFDAAVRSMEEQIAREVTREDHDQSSEEDQFDRAIDHWQVSHEGFGSQAESQGTGVAHVEGWDSEELLRQLVVSARVGLERLTRANIVRRYGLPSGDTIYELVHDGFGPTLDTWGDRRLRQPDVVLDSITPLVGLTIEVDLQGRAETTDDERAAASGGLPPQETLHGVRWQGCWLEKKDETGLRTDQLEITDLEFVDGDFGGTAFHECVLRNVTFTNCTLRGTVFLFCELDNVTFRYLGDEEEGDKIDTLVIRRSKGTDVTFENLRGVTGLQLVGIQGTRWSLRRCSIQHIKIDPAEPTDVTCADGTTLRQALVTERAALTLDGSTIE